MEAVNSDNGERAPAQGVSGLADQLAGAAIQAANAEGQGEARGPNASRPAESRSERHERHEKERSDHFLDAINDQLRLREQVGELEKQVQTLSKPREQQPKPPKPTQQASQAPKRRRGKGKGKGKPFGKPYHPRRLSGPAAILLANQAAAYLDKAERPNKPWHKGHHKGGPRPANADS